MVPMDQAAERLAADLLATYGDDAALAASERAAAMEKIGNPEAAQVWVAVSEILARRRARRGGPTPETLTFRRSKAIVYPAQFRYVTA